MFRVIFFPLKMLGRLVNFLVRLVLTLLIVATLTLAGYVAVRSSQPVGLDSVTTTSQSEMNYWHYMADRLDASRQTPTNCHRTRLIYLAIALPMYPALYTYVALYPESSLAHHIQPSPLLPEPVTWQQVPETWWRLVEQVSVLAFTQPQWDYTPAVGQKVRVDQRCIAPGFDLDTEKMKDTGSRRGFANWV